MVLSDYGIEWLWYWVIIVLSDYGIEWLWYWVIMVLSDYGIEWLSYWVIIVLSDYRIEWLSYWVIMVLSDYGIEWLWCIKNTHYISHSKHPEIYIEMKYTKYHLNKKLKQNIKSDPMYNYSSASRIGW